MREPRKKQIDFWVNEAYLPYFFDDTRVQIFFGGSSSGKSFFLAQRLVLDVLRGRNYLVIRNVANTLRQSVYNQIVKSVSEMGLESLFVIGKSELTITCKANGRQILFAGLDDVEKLKSITPARGTLTDIWMEEATEAGYRDYKQLSKRLRGRVPGGFAKRVILSFNPVVKEHWIYKEFFGRWDERENQYKDDGLLIVKTTYKDNAYLTSDDVAALETEQDRYFYEVYTLGNWGVLGKVVFTNWRVEDLRNKKHTFDHIYNGLDFGFSSDPNAMVRAHVDRKRKRIYVFEELYKAGMHDDELAEELRRRIGGQYITCDSSDPKAIDDLCRRGVKAAAAVKGPDSIRYGIRFLQGFEIVIDVSCRHFKNEIQLYQWAQDAFGNTLQKPKDKNNHLLDALRYAVEDLMLESRASAVRRL